MKAELCDRITAKSYKQDSDSSVEGHPAHLEKVVRMRSNERRHTLALIYFEESPDLLHRINTKSGCIVSKDWTVCPFNEEVTALVMGNLRARLSIKHDSSM